MSSSPTSPIPDDISSSRGSLSRAATGVGLFTLLSRILGFLRDSLTASYLGAGFYSDAFFVAYRIPNLFRRLFAEGAMTVAFVPIFTRLLLQQGREAAQHFVRSALSVLSLVLLMLVLAAELFAKPFCWLFASGFALEKLELTVQLTRITFPYIALISIASLTMGVLNSIKHFSTPAFSSSLLNVAMIVSLLVSPWLPWHPVYSLAWGILIGGLLQVALQTWAMARNDYHLRFGSLKTLSSEVGVMAKLMIPSIFGAAAYQLNIVINTQLASHLGEGAVSYLYYSDRILEFPLGMVAVSLGTVILTYMSQQAAAGNIEAMKATMREALRALYFLLLPAMVGIIVLRLPIVDLLYHRHAFTGEDAKHTATVLLYSSMGLMSIGSVRIVLPLFYAMKDTMTPFLVSLSSMVINVIAAVALMPYLQYAGLALAISISAMFNTWLLFYIIRRRIGSLGIRMILGAILRTSLGAGVMGLFCWLGQLYFQWGPDSTMPRLIYTATLLTTIAVAACIYFLVCRWLRIPEANRLFSYVLSKIKR